MTWGKFISFEGIDGAGKSTQIAHLQALVLSHGKEVMLTREPGGTALGEQLRELVLNRQEVPVCAASELAIMFAARAQHVHQVIGPALQRGQWVLCDRFTDATYAYQGGGRGLPVEQIQQLEAWMQNGIENAFGRAIQPDRTYLFDLDPAVAEQRRSSVRQADRFESEQQAFFQAVRAVYVKRAQQDSSRFCVLDALETQNEIKVLLEKDFLRYCL